MNTRPDICGKIYKQSLLLCLKRYPLRKGDKLECTFTQGRQNGFFEVNRMNTHCMVCQRIEKIKRGENPYFVKELETGYVVIGDFQRFKGYTLFICKECQPEIHLIEPAFRKKSSL